MLLVMLCEYSPKFMDRSSHPNSWTGSLWDHSWVGGTIMIAINAARTSKETQRSWS